MIVATLNLNWGGEPHAPGCAGQPRVGGLVDALVRLDADVLVLTEFKQGTLGARIRKGLADAGYGTFIAQPQGPFALGTAIASRLNARPAVLPVPASCDPWRATGADFGTWMVYGFYFPLGEAKQLYWEWVLANAAHLSGLPVFLAGDFNTGLRRVDEAGDSFDCQEAHLALAKSGFVDLWRDQHPAGREYTWYSAHGNGFRLDYIWASRTSRPHVLSAWHAHAPRLARVTDHSAVVTEII